MKGKKIEREKKILYKGGTNIPIKTTGVEIIKLLIALNVISISI